MALHDLITEELTAQIAIKRLESDDGIETTALLIADVVFRVFDVRRR